MIVTKTFFFLTQLNIEKIYTYILKIVIITSTAKTTAKNSSYNTYFNVLYNKQATIQVKHLFNEMD
jgi:hypothetical protein